MLSEPALAETLTFADAKHYLSVERDFRKLYPWAGVPDGIWEMVTEFPGTIARLPGRP